MPSVAVVVPCRNEAARLPALLAALVSQSRRPDDIVVVNDASTDDSAEVVRSWAASHPAVPIRVIDGPGLGPAAATNAGIRSVDATVIMRMDGHALPDAHYLERSLETLATVPQAGIVGGAWHVMPGAPTRVARAIAAVVSHPAGSGGAAYRSAQGGGVRDVETVPFGIYARSLWTELGGYDEALAVNEDFDFNFRARQAGYRIVFVPGVTSRYFARPTLTTLGRQYFRYGWWKARALAKDRRALHPRQVPPIVLLPWIGATIGGVLMAPGLWSGICAAAYPMLLVVAAGHVAVRKQVAYDAACAALATVHLAWSAGFWAAVVGRRR